MPLAMPAVPLNRALDIPLNQLSFSQANLRQINAGISRDDLREDIAARGLLQSLNVRPILDAAGNPTACSPTLAGCRSFCAGRLTIMKMTGARSTSCRLSLPKRGAIPSLQPPANFLN